MKFTHTQNIQLCCYCGTRKATTKDHIPPKSIFNKPRPNDLITVPCWFECNNEASKYDEKFKAYLGMHIARQGGEAERLFKEGVLPTAKHNNKLRKTIFDTMHPVYTTTQSGIITGKAMSVLWDNEAHDFTVERIIRGLFYHHYKKIIGSSACVKTHWFKQLPNGYENMLYGKTIAKGQFVYLYNRVDEADFDSIWMLNFYSGHFAGGTVTSPEFESSFY